MRILMSIMLALSIVICFSNIPASAAEHGGKEHGGKTQEEKEHGGAGLEKEHGGAEVQAEPTREDIRTAMKDYVVKESEETGTFDILDPETGTLRNLTLVRVHERVGKTGDYYYSCADFTDTNTGELLDLDLDVEYKEGGLNVVDVRIHKTSGKERYTYDENDNRIPVSN